MIRPCARIRRQPGRTPSAPARAISATPRHVPLLAPADAQESVRHRTADRRIALGTSAASKHVSAEPSSPARRESIPGAKSSLRDLIRSREPPAGERPGIISARVAAHPVPVRIRKRARQALILGLLRLSPSSLSPIIDAPVVQENTSSRSIAHEKVAHASPFRHRRSRFPGRLLSIAYGRPRAPAGRCAAAGRRCHPAGHDASRRDLPGKRELTRGSRLRERPRKLIRQHVTPRPCVQGPPHGRGGDGGRGPGGDVA